VAALKIVIPPIIAMPNVNNPRVAQNLLLLSLIKGDNEVMIPSI
jgi:hypothetical protein